MQNKSILQLYQQFCLIWPVNYSEFSTKNPVSQKDPFYPLNSAQSHMKGSRRSLMDESILFLKFEEIAS